MEQNRVLRFEIQNALDEFLDALGDLQQRRNLSNEEMLKEINNQLGLDIADAYEEWLAEGEE